jgi:hypothetical protein
LNIRTTLVILFFLALCTHWFSFGTMLVDAHVYAHALNTYYHGGDPYLQDSKYRFIYAPMFLQVPNLGRVAWYSYLAIDMACLLSIPYAISRFLEGSWATTAWCYLIFTFVPTFAGEMTLLSGNVGSILYAAVLFSGLRGMKRGEWLPFYLSVIVSASLKPAMLAFLLLPTLISAAWIPSAVSIGAVGAIFGIQRLAWPVQFKEFQAAVHSQLYEHGDLGYGITGLMHGTHMSFIVHVGAVLLFVVYLWWVRSDRDAGWLAALLILCVFANPRPIHYDVAVAAVPAVYLLSTSFRRSPALSGVCVSILLLSFSRSVPVGMLEFMMFPLAMYVILRMYGQPIHHPEEQKQG